jgi:integrase/recombinase XerD
MNEKSNENLKSYSQELVNRNYARNIRSLYITALEKFLQFRILTSIKDPADKIKHFLSTVIVSNARRKQFYSAIKLFYELVPEKECPYVLHKVRSRKRLPVVLSKEEILKILDHIQNKKHHVMISLLYASGLRISEVAALKMGDIDVSRLSIHVRDSKQNKDRLTVVSDSLVPVLDGFIHDTKPRDCLFCTVSNTKYQTRTIQQIFSKALLCSGIKKHATCHTLRHSFASHLVENGTSIPVVQQLLGHASIKTTVVYVHIADPIASKVKSPL